LTTVSIFENRLKKKHIVADKKNWGKIWQDLTKRRQTQKVMELTLAPYFSFKLKRYIAQVEFYKIFRFHLKIDRRKNCMKCKRSLWNFEKIERSFYHIWLSRMPGLKDHIRKFKKNWKGIISYLNEENVSCERENQTNYKMLSQIFVCLFQNWYFFNSNMLKWFRNFFKRDTRSVVSSSNFLSIDLKMKTEKFLKFNFCSLSF
jgi:hypothetical protein